MDCPGTNIKISAKAPFETEPLFHHFKMPNVVNAAKETENKSLLSPLQKQILAVFSSICLTITSGMTSGYSAILIPQLQHPNSTISLSLEDATWIASMAPMSMALGCIFSTSLMQKYGRRTALQVSCVPFILGWIAISAAPNIIFLFVGRFLTGVSVGLVGPIVPVYIAEIVSPVHRGIFLSTIGLGISFGIFSSHGLGMILKWQYAAAVCVLFPLTCFMCLFGVCESPMWLISQGRTDDAKYAFFWFRGTDKNALEELETMIHVSREKREENKSKKNKKWISIFKNISDKSFLKPFSIMTIFFFIQQFSGINTIAYYTIFILEEVEKGFDTYAATLILDIVRLLMSFIACILLKKFSRRLMAILSCCGCTISLFGLGIFLDLMIPENRNQFSWVPLLFIIGYISSICIGLVPLPWAMIGEVFPASFREFGSAVTSCLCYLIFTTVVKTGPILFIYLGPSATFYIYGSIALFGAVFLYNFLPETSNKTLREIEVESFDKKKEYGDF